MDQYQQNQTYCLANLLKQPQPHVRLQMRAIKPANCNNKMSESKHMKCVLSETDKEVLHWGHRQKNWDFNQEREDHIPLEQLASQRIHSIAFKEKQEQDYEPPLTKKSVSGKSNSGPIEIKKQASSKIQEKLPQDCRNQINRLVQKLKKNTKTEISKFQQFRKKVEQRLFYYMTVALQELKLKVQNSFQQADKEQSILLNLKEEKLYDVILSKASKYQNAFNNFTKKQPSDITLLYPQKIQKIIDNLADLENEELRRKLLMGVISPETLPRLKEEDLRSEIKKIQHKKLISYFSDASTVKEDTKIEEQKSIVVEVPQKVQQKSIYIFSKPINALQDKLDGDNSKLITQLKELMLQNRMGTRLEEQLPNKIAVRLTNHLKKILS